MCVCVCVCVSGRPGCEAAGAAGRQLAGGEDGEPDADGGEQHRHGQHLLPELHGVPGGDRKGESRAIKRINTIKLNDFALASCAITTLRFITS